jgi:hypothetical protein
MAEAVVFQIVVETPNCSNPTCTHNFHSDLTIFFQHLQPKPENTMLQTAVSDVSYSTVNKEVYLRVFMSLTPSKCIQNSNNQPMCAASFEEEEGGKKITATLS